MGKKLLSAVLVLCMMASVLCVGTGAWNVPDQSGDVYDISNVDELYWFAAQVNSGNTSINGRLTADIVINENVLAANGTPNIGDFQIWTPIGFCVPGGTQRLYTGTFDGNGKTISGLYFEFGGAENIGLFGCIGPGGSVMNVNVADSYLLGGRFVGGIAGCNGGFIRNCTVAATLVAMEDGVGGVAGVNYGNLDQCAAAGSVNGGNDAGGVVGTNSGTVSNCFNTGTVYAEDFCAGGVVGFNCGMVIHCYNAGAIINGTTQGGVTGGNTGTVENSYYLSGSAPVSAEGRMQTAQEFASGMVCYLLQSEQANQIWGQKLGRDAYPVFSDDKVIAIENNENEIIGYENEPKPGVTVSGTITSYLADGDVTVELVRDGAVTYSAVVSGGGVEDAMEGVEAGAYTLRVGKDNHATREYEITVGQEDVAFDGEIFPIGDVTGDGSVNIKDFQRLLRHVNKTSLLSDYALVCGDVTDDGSCNIKDFQRLLRHVNKTNPLF